MRIHRAQAVAVILLCAACAPEAPSAPQSLPDGPGPVVVEPGSDLGLSADSICFQIDLGGPGPLRDDVRITSTTGSEFHDLTSAITYGPGQPTGWLMASFDRSETPARLWLELGSASALVPVGDWWADVTVSAPSAGAPRVIRVHFTVRPAASGALVTLQLGGYTLNTLSPGTGTVTGSGFDCDFTPASVCSQRVPVGTVLTLTATPDTNNFLLWWVTPDCPETRELQCRVTVTGDLTVTTYFALDGYNILVSVMGAGAEGSVEAPDGSDLPGGINCQLVAGVQSGSCGAQQWYGDRATTLTARAREGSVFVGWSGACNGNGNACLLAPLPGGSYSVTAMFERQ